MPLIDHFHAPGENYAPWGSVGMCWVASLKRWLTRTLPRDRYRTFVSAHLGRDAEADIAEFELADGWTPDADRNGDGGGVATLTVPAATATIEASFTRRQTSSTARSGVTTSSENPATAPVAVGRATIPPIPIPSFSSSRRECCCAMSAL